MATLEPEHIRNIALVGHTNVGKTILTEAMLTTGHAIQHMGRIENGTTASDYHPDEIARKASIHASVLTMESDGVKFNLLDAPGLSDFVGEMKSCLRVADTALLSLAANTGIDIGADRAWMFAEEEKCAVVIFINKLDAEGARFDDVVAEAKEHFGHDVAIVQFPVTSGPMFNEVVDVLKMKVLKFASDGSGKVTEQEIPAALQAKAEAARSELLEKVAESDEALLNTFFEKGTLTDEELRKGFRLSLIHRHVFPVLCGAAVKAMGVATLIDFTREYAPNPFEHGEVHGHKPGSEDDVAVLNSVNGPTVLFVFKTISEAHIGDLSFFRVYSGKVDHGMDLLNDENGKVERLSQLFIVNGKARKEVSTLVAGDIGAVLKLKDTHTGDTLSTKNFPVILPPIRLPEPVITSALRATSRGDEDKLAAALHSLHEEDPTFIVTHEPELHQILINGQGEQHLETAVRRLKEKFTGGLEIVEPKIPYRETVKAKADTRYRHKKQTGGAGQFGEVAIKLQPLARGKGYEFEDEIVGGVITGKHIPAVDKGIQELLMHGPYAGYPVVDVKVVLYDGKEHPVDSNENAFKSAGKYAFRDAFLAAKPMLLEPMYELEVQVPSANMGDVMGDLSSRRARILGMDSRGRFEVIRALAPLAELHHYATRLRSLTQGKAMHSQRFVGYEEVPKELEAKIVAASEKKTNGEE